MDINPGERVKSAMDRVRNRDIGSFSENMSADMPDDPGPAVAGRTPLVGTLRREQDMPVLRDQLQEMMD